MTRFLKYLGLLVVVCLIVGMSCVTGVIIGAGSGSLGGGFGRDAVAVVYIEGPILGGSGSGFFSEGAHSDQVTRWLRRAMDDPSVKAVVLRVDSPGGGVTASDEIYNQMLKLKAKKPVVASFGSLAASGGYYVSAGATKIVANQTSLTGSIGVITVVPNVQGLLEKLGVEMYVLASGDHKGDTSGLTPITAEDRAILQGVVDETYRRFVSVVSTGRNMTPARVRELADGRIYTGRQAKEHGLVDEFGDLPEAITAAAVLGGITGEPGVVHYRSEGLFGGGANSALFGLLRLPLLPPLHSSAATTITPFSLQYLYLTP